MSGARRSGVLMPVFSMRSARSWGIGELGDLAGFAHWLRLAGQSFVQLLPINEMPPGERSPYSSLTAMALDPIFISVPEVEDLAALGGELALDTEDRAAIDAVTRTPGLDYGLVRSLKDRVLRRAHERFVRVEHARGTPRAARFEAFLEGEAWWLDEYATFRAFSAQFDDRAWWDWPEGVAACRKEAVADLAGALDEEIRYRKYLQWVAAEQWTRARRLAWPVRVFGDLPFMVSANSPDVWARQEQFRRDATIGVPPDAFSDTGQDWGLPPWRADVMAATGFAWMQARARRSAAIYDGFRLDHLVGLYRIYVRPLDPVQQAFFVPADEEGQIALGERLVQIYQQSGAQITAEDLGTVPDFVRRSLARLDVPGYKVLRWEREWDDPAQPFIDPGSYPEAAVATPGTHDSESITAWWTSMSGADRNAVMSLPTVARSLDGSHEGADSAAMTRPLLDALLKALLASPSRLVILPMQDLFGWADRINTPGTVGDDNWSWRSPFSIEALAQEREPLERATELARWTREAGR